MLREKVFEFNNDYWTQQNLKFVEAKRKYLQRMKVIEELQKRRWASENPSAAHDEKVAAPSRQADDLDIKMNEFYRQWLNENYHSHSDYNWQWYKYNFALLYLAARVNLHRLGKNVRSLARKKRPLE
jgi:hypothetical protein